MEENPHGPYSGWTIRENEDEKEEGGGRSQRRNSCRGVTNGLKYFT